MSVTINYFFNHPKPLGELATDMRGWMGFDLQPYEGDPDDLYCRLLRMEFDLGVHDLDDDRDVRFSEYKYQAGIRTPWPDADFRPHQLLTMATLAYAMHRRLGVAGMLVYGVQVPLARYERRTDAISGEAELFDAIGDEPVVYPAHFETLMSRMRR